MRVTQGTFSFLPDLTDDEIRAQIDYALAQGWALSVECTDDPHPRNYYWEMLGNPMFDLRDAAGVMAQVVASRAQYPDSALLARRPRVARSGIRSPATRPIGPKAVATPDAAHR